MITGHKLYILEYVDLKLINEADSYVSFKKKAYIKWAILAACLCICIGLSTIWLISYIEKANSDAHETSLSEEARPYHFFEMPLGSAAFPQNTIDNEFYINCSEISVNGKLYHASDFTDFLDNSALMKQLYIDGYSISNIDNSEKNVIHNLETKTFFDQLFSGQNIRLFIESDSEPRASDSGTIPDASIESVADIAIGDRLMEVYARYILNGEESITIGIFSEGLVSFNLGGNDIIIYIGKDIVKDFMYRLEQKEGDAY